VIMLSVLFLANICMLLGMTNWPQSVREGFTNEFVSNPKGSAFATAPIGAYDGVNVAANLPPDAGGWRGTSPNVPLNGPPVELGPDNLFLFKHNECKPECCGATLSCDGGCVCTTPEQRKFINTRGGNRTVEDGF
jgi:hypothetical protein